ncbi:MAG: hypothetical protein KKA41_02710 [Proteobacteria bacterium]|nr:hypothetical protein [Pseudomonadota bacterium]
MPSKSPKNRENPMIEALGDYRWPSDMLLATWRMAETGAAPDIALGADGVVVGTAEMIALGCVRCSRCSAGRGCPGGIATTDPGLVNQMDLEWGTQRLINLYTAWRKDLVEILKKFGMRSVRELVGRSDLLTHLDFP